MDFSSIYDNLYLKDCFRNLKMENDVSLFNENVKDEVDSMIEEIKDSVKVDDEASFIVEEIKKSSEIKTTTIETNPIFQVTKAPVSSSVCYKDELNKKFNDISSDISDLERDYNLIEDWLEAVSNEVISLESYKRENKKSIEIIRYKINEANAAISGLENRAASIEHRQNNLFKENLALKDRLATMKKRINITDIILAASIIAYTIRFLTLGF